MLGQQVVVPFVPSTSAGNLPRAVRVIRPLEGVFLKWAWKELRVGGWLCHMYCSLIKVHTQRHGGLASPLSAPDSASLARLSKAIARVGRGLIQRVALAALGARAVALALGAHPRLIQHELIERETQTAPHTPGAEDVALLLARTEYDAVEILGRAADVAEATGLARRLRLGHLRSLVATFLGSWDALRRLAVGHGQGPRGREKTGRRGGKGGLGGNGHDIGIGGRPMLLYRLGMCVLHFVDGLQRAGRLWEREGFNMKIVEVRRRLGRRR